MKRFALTSMILLMAAWAMPLPAGARPAPDADARIAAQQQAMRPLNGIDGVWRGTTTEYQPDGRKLERGYTERITSLLDGTLKLLEGSKESVEGADDFHVICILSHDPETKKFTLRAWWPFGLAFDSAFEIREEGFHYRTDLPDGRYMEATGTIKDGIWREKFELVTPGQPARLMEERVLKRVGD